MRRLSVLVAAWCLCAACSAPPQKEIDTAQGALDAARAAGAEQYARETYEAATTALQQAHDAVAQRDYRSALSRALDAGERAREAAKLAADGKARTRSESEALIAATAQVQTRLQEQLKAAEAVRVPAKELGPARQLAARAQAALQEARTAVAEGRYLEAADLLKGMPEEINARLTALDTAIDARHARPGRRRR